MSKGFMADNYWQRNRAHWGSYGRDIRRNIWEKRGTGTRKEDVRDEGKTEDGGMLGGRGISDSMG
eukprot:1933845-Pleurochrysis_carterae.AAC.2